MENIKQYLSLKFKTLKVDGLKFSNFKTTNSNSNLIGFGKDYVIKIEQKKHKLKLKSLIQESNIIAYLNSQNCISCPKLFSVGKLTTGEPYFILEKVESNGKVSPVDILFSILEQKSFGIYQGDIKFENLIFNGSICYLIDYDQSEKIEKIKKMGNIEYIDWIAKKYYERWTTDFFHYPIKIFDKNKISDYFKNDSLNLSNVTMFKKQETTMSKTGFYHTLNNPKVFINGARNLKVRERVLNKLKIKKGEKILDVGCNLGLLTHYLYDRGAKVIGIDMDKNIITAAKMVANIIGKDVNFFTIDVDSKSSLDTLKDQFDTIFLFSVLHHLNNPNQIIQYIVPRCNRIILEVRLKEKGFKSINGMWKTTTCWNFENLKELIKYLESIFFTFKFEKNLGKVDRNRFILSFKKSFRSLNK